MISNLEKYKKDIDSLLRRGNRLYLALQHEENTTDFERRMRKQMGDDEAAEFWKSLPIFKSSYQSWYSEAKPMIRQLLPDRAEDFARLYEKGKQRKEITGENYSIEDCLQGFNITRNNGMLSEKVVGPDAAIPRVYQQVAIVEAAKARFESSLFDIRQLLQADLFDSELDAAEHLLKNKFARAAGALSGVVLERHLGEVCSSHQVQLKKKDPTISELNDALKNAGAIDTAQWRFIQHLGDIRNLCDHSKKVEPTNEQVQDLLDGVGKVIKTIF